MADKPHPAKAPKTSAKAPEPAPAPPVEASLPAESQVAANTPIEVKAEAKTGEVVDAAKPEPPNPAAWMHERLVRQIVEFEKALDPEHEVGCRFVEGPNNEALHIENVASWGPDMVIFFGQYSDGRKFELMQHYSQVSMLLTSVRKLTEEPRRIGFELLRTLNDQPPPWGDPVS